MKTPKSEIKRYTRILNKYLKLNAPTVLINMITKEIEYLKTQTVKGGK